MSRIVIDSNVWVSALVFGGKPRAVFEAVLRGGDIIILSQEITTEVRRILAKKFPDFVEDFEAILQILAGRIEYVKLGSVTVEVSRDDDDNRVIETAVVGKAACIISGDKDLLTLKTRRKVKIIAPSEALLLI